MKRTAILIVCTLTLTIGCTHVSLQRRTLKQASTLTDLQYQQVLDNLAMFVCDPKTTPWHVKLKGGTVQIADQGNLGFEANLASAISAEVKHIYSPSVGAQHGIVNQWDVEPTIDADELELLRLAYVKAVCPLDSATLETIDEKICGLSVQFDLLPSERTTSRILIRGEVESKIIDRLVRICEQQKEARWDEGKFPLSIHNRIERLEKLGGPGSLKDCLIDTSTDDTAKQYFNVLSEDLKLRKLDLIQTWRAVQELTDPSLGQDVSGSPTYRMANARSRQSLSSASSNAQARSNQKHVLATKGPLPELGELVPALKAFLEADLLPTPINPTDQILTALEMAYDDTYRPPAATREESLRNVGLVAQAEEKIEKLQQLVDDPRFAQPWLCRGSKCDVPKHACYVGHYSNCGCKCYVWVMPEKLDVLRDFTSILLSLAPLDKQEVFPRGAAFSPGLR